jgi:hypothetical protein
LEDDRKPGRTDAPRMISAATARRHRLFRELLVCMGCLVSICAVRPFEEHPDARRRLLEVKITGAVRLGGKEVDMVV